MKLTTELGGTGDVTNREDLERALATLGDEGDTFATLASSDGSYVQAAASDGGGFLLERCDASGRPAQSSRRNFTRPEIVALFAAWLDDSNGAWKASVEWAEPERRAARAAPSRGRRRPGAGVPLLTGVLLLALGALILSTGVWIWRDHAAFVARSDRALGIVVRVVDVGTARRPSARPVVRFVTPDGTPRTFFSDWAASEWVGATGRTVAVRYTRSAPVEARIDSAIDLWVIPGILTAVGALFTATALALLARRLRTPPPRRRALVR